MECGARYVSGAPGLRGMTVDDMKVLLGQIGKRKTGLRADLCQSIIESINSGMLRLDLDGKIRSTTNQSLISSPSVVPPIKLPGSGRGSKRPSVIPPVQLPQPSIPISSPSIASSSTSRPKIMPMHSLVSPSTLSESTHPMIAIGHGFYKTKPEPPPSYFKQSPTAINEMIFETVIEGDADKAKKQYLNYVEFLLEGHVKYDLFAKVFPDYTCERSAIYVKNHIAYAWPNETKLMQCVNTKIETGHPVAISAIVPGHATMLWFDPTNKVIDRYDSHRVGWNGYDDAILKLIRRLYPDWMYVGNISKNIGQCVQSARVKERLPQQGKRETSDWFCQDYTILYTLLRIRGYSFEEAGRIMVSRQDDILQDITGLMQLLVYQARLEAGKEPIIVPPDVSQIFPSSPGIMR